MADQEVVLGLNLDISKVQNALYDMIGSFTGTGKEFDKISSQIEKSFKNLEAVTKRYGASSDEAANAAKNYQKSLTALVANGVDPASAHFKILENAVNGANNALNNSANNLKRTNQAWTNLSLVVQDLPYGFRGIQNNLPALFGSMVSGAGAVYFAFSAVIAAITAWDMGLFGLKKKTEDVTQAQDSYNESLKTSISSAYGEISTVKSLVSVVENQGIAIDKRKLALKRLQDEYPGYFKNMSLEKISITELETSTKNLTTAIIARAEANAMSSEIEKKAAERYANTKEYDKNETAILNMKNALVTLSREEEVHFTQYGTILRTKSPYDKQLDKIKELEKANSKLNTSNEILTNSISQLQNSINYRTPLTVGLGEGKPQKETVKKEKIKYEDLIKVTDEYYQVKLNFAEGDQKEQVSILQQEQQTLDEYLNGNLISLEDYFKKSSEIYKKVYDLRKSLANQSISDANKEKNGLVSAFKQTYSDQLQLAQGNKEETSKILQEQAQEQFDLYTNGITNYADFVSIFSDIYSKFVTNNEALTKQAEAGIMKIGTGIMSALGPALDMLLEKGASIGEVLSAAFNDVIKKLIKVAIAAAIAVAVISLIPGMQADVAQAGGYLKTFGKLFAGGMGLPNLFESKGNSNGVSGSSGINAIESVKGVAPGNTLSTKISGNDLLILMNRADRNNQSTY